MIGKFPAKLDDKNRLFVPSKLRGELEGDFFVTLGVNCGRRCRLCGSAALIGRNKPRGAGNATDGQEDIPIAIVS